MNFIKETNDMFDKEFPNLMVFDSEQKDLVPMRDEIKSFISARITSLIEEMEKHCEEMKEPNQQVSEYYSGYNRFAADLQTYLKQL